MATTPDVYFPEQRHQLPMTLIRRERLLPEGIEGQVETAMGARVTLRDILVRGEAPSPYIVIDALRALRLRRASDVEGAMTVEVGDIIGEGQIIAQKRRRKIVSPATAKLIGYDEGRILLQRIPESMELEAGLNGQVVGITRGRGAVIETFGAVLQGVWGNGRRSTGVLRMEPSAGMEVIRDDAIDMQYRGAILVTRRPLTRMSLAVMTTQEFAGLIAPSLEPDMIDAILDAPGAILITEGFGQMRMSSTAAQFLDDCDGRQATLDALLPTLDSPRRPEVLLNVPLMTGERPTAPLANIALGVGSNVRVARGAGAGSFGQVTSLPKAPILMDNGLRVPGAQVLIVTGETLIVPLANLEVSGQ